MLGKVQREHCVQKWYRCMNYQMIDFEVTIKWIQKITMMNLKRRNWLKLEPSLLIFFFKEAKSVDIYCLFVLIFEIFQVILVEIRRNFFWKKGYEDSLGYKWNKICRGRDEGVKFWGFLWNTDTWDWRCFASGVRHHFPNFFRWQCVIVNVMSYTCVCVGVSWGLKYTREK